VIGGPIAQHASKTRLRSNRRLGRRNSLRPMSGRTLWSHRKTRPTWTCSSLIGLPLTPRRCRRRHVALWTKWHRGSWWCSASSTPERADDPGIGDHLSELRHERRPRSCKPTPARSFTTAPVAARSCVRSPATAACSALTDRYPARQSSNSEVAGNKSTPMTGDPRPRVIQGIGTEK
jgi:hypothetical protein